MSFILTCMCTTYKEKKKEGGGSTWCCMVISNKVNRLCVPLKSTVCDFKEWGRVKMGLHVCLSKPGLTISSVKAKKRKKKKKKKKRHFIARYINKALWHYPIAVMWVSCVVLCTIIYIQHIQDTLKWAYSSAQWTYQVHSAISPKNTQRDDVCSSG